MKIIKQFRKTLSVKIDSSGEVVVKIPKFASKKSVENFLEKHKDWIEKQQKKVLKNKKEFRIGERFYFFGEDYLLVLKQHLTSSLSILELPLLGKVNLPYPLEKRGIAKLSTSFFFEEKDGGGGIFFTTLQNSEDIQQAFIKFYKTEAKKYIVSRTYEITETLGLSFNKIRITSAKTRWGSCSSKKNLNFSWKLILTKKEAIDYVIIHELAHLTEMNHSKKFWDLVEVYSEKLGNGDWKKHREYLKNFTEINNF